MLYNDADVVPIAPPVRCTPAELAAVHVEVGRAGLKVHDLGLLGAHWQARLKNGSGHELLGQGNSPVEALLDAVPKN